MESFRRPGGRRVLLPAEVELCETVGITEDEYWYFVEVNVCIADNNDINNITNTLTTDTWLAASLSYDPEVVEVLLSSAIDSVGSNVPSLVLTTEVVGKLPVTSDIQNR